MNYNSESSNQDVVSEVLLMCKATIATYPLNDLTRRFNAALDEYFDLAFDSAGVWPFDDVNQSSAAIATQALTSGTNAYKISSFSGSVTNILGLTILDSDGNVRQMTPEDFDPNTFEQSYTTDDTGTPSYYTKFGDYIRVRVTPNYTNASGLRAYVERNPLYMTFSDTNKEPGVPKKHHMYLCRKTALPYLVENNMRHASAIAQLIQQDEREIQEYYAYRDKATPQRFTVDFNGSNSNK